MYEWNYFGNQYPIFKNFTFELQSNSFKYEYFLDHSCLVHGIAALNRLKQ